LGKYGQRNEQKVWKTGHRNEQIIGKIWWILPKAGKQNGGYTRKHIIKRKKFRLYTKTYNKMRKVSVVFENITTVKVTAVTLTAVT